MFQSTLPAGGATVVVQRRAVRIHGFNPRSPRGERPGLFYPRIGEFRFQSTLPAGGATQISAHIRPVNVVSIHAPRGGSDLILNFLGISAPEFQSTLPAGGATTAACQSSSVSAVSIHAPRGGSDVLTFIEESEYTVVSIHAPRGGSDKFTKRIKETIYSFNPRSPRGERRTPSRPYRRQRRFNPRSPRGERLHCCWRQSNHLMVSIHAPRGGSDQDDLTA